MFLFPAPRSLWERMAHEVAPVETPRAVQGAQRSLQFRDADIRIVVCFDQVVEVQGTVRPGQTRKHLDRKVGVGFVVLREKEEVAKHGVFGR